MQDGRTASIVLLCLSDVDGWPQRSSTGTTGKAISKTRTSDNAFVTHTKTAQALKRRIFQLLGIEEYHESWADGLQVPSELSTLVPFNTRDNSFFTLISIYYVKSSFKG